jgi:O-antigen/teichoic acid export membrane protein
LKFVSRIIRSQRFKNSFWNSVEAIFYPLLIILFTPIFLNKLGPEDYGIWMLVNSILFTLSIFNFGIADAVIKHLPGYYVNKDANGTQSVLSSAFLFSCILFSIVVISGWLVSAYLSVFNPFDFNPSRVQVISLVVNVASITFGLKLIEQVFLAAFKGVLRYDLASKISVGVKSGTVLVNVLLALLGYSLLYLFYSALFISVVGLFVEFFLIKKIFPGFKLSRGHSMWKLLNFGVWTWIQSSLALVALQVDKFIVTKYFGLEILSYYSIGYMISSQLHVLFVALSGWIFPEVAARVERNESINSLYYNMRFLLVGFGLSVILVMFILKDFVFELWLGPVIYQKSARYISTFLLYEAFLLLNIIPFYFLNGSGREKLNTFFEFLSKILNIILMIVFFNWLGAIGLVWGLVASMIIAVPIQACFLYSKVLPGKKWFQGLSLIIPSAALVGALVVDQIWLKGILMMLMIYSFKRIYWDHSTIRNLNDMVPK